MNYNVGKNHPKFINLTGQKIGKLNIIEYVYTKGRGNESRWVWKCICECGNKCYVRTTKLQKNNPQTCCKVCSDNKWSKIRVLNDFLSLKKRIYRTYKRNAKKRNYLFDLNFEELNNIIQENCYYCGEPPIENKGDQTYTYGQGIFKRNGIDRKNNEEGYTMKNVVSCCKHCNTIKLDFSYDEFTKKILKIIKHLNL